jgi:hypothetical protein
MDISKLKELMKQKKQDMKVKEKTVKLNPGKNRIVLLPGWRKGEEHVWFHDFGQHFIKNDKKEIQAVYPCLDATFGKPCPICEGLSSASHMAADDETVNLLAEAKASRSVLINALMLDGSEPNTPVILEVKRSVFGQLVDIIEEWGAEAFSREIAISRDGKGLNTKYTAGITAKAFEVPAAALAKINNLDDYVRQESEDQQRRALSAINNVAGLLPSGSDKPKTTASTLDSDQDGALRSMGSGKVASTSKAEMPLDEELDDLLADLGTGTDD